MKHCKQWKQNLQGKWRKREEFSRLDILEIWCLSSKDQTESPNMFLDHIVHFILYSSCLSLHFDHQQYYGGHYGLQCYIDDQRQANLNSNCYDIGFAILYVLLYMRGHFKPWTGINNPRVDWINEKEPSLLRSMQNSKANQNNSLLPMRCLHHWIRPSLSLGW